ncbi:MAG: alpha/beta hydrolase family protein [Nitrospinota bacterium]
MLFSLAACTPGHYWYTERGDRVHEFFLEVEGRRVEVMAVRPKGRAPFPAVIFIHGSQGRAQRYRSIMLKLARRGFATASISLPGFGASEGLDDFAGPASVKSVLALIDYISGRRYVMKDAMALYGIFRGATVALLAASKSPLIGAVILQAGAYDMGEAYRTAPEDVRKRMGRILGGPPEEASQAYRERSPLYSLEGLRATVLIVHGKRTKRYPREQALILRDALRRQGKRVRLELHSKEDNEYVPDKRVIIDLMLPFLEEELGLKEKRKRKPWWRIF